MKSSTSLSIYTLLRIAMLLFGSALFGPIGIIVAIVIVVLAIANEKDTNTEQKGN